jgi:hypothetical protein
MDIVSIIFFSFFLSNHYKVTKIFGNKNNIVTTTIQTIVTEKEEICEISGDLLKHHAEKLNSLLHTQSIRRRLDSYNFGATDFDYTTGLKHQKSA